MEAIASARPDQLYIFSDAPREGDMQDSIKVAETRLLFENFDWPVTPHTNYQTLNLGCARAVVTAINWIFENENEAIILEDDCLPDITFFKYCARMLEQYADDRRIMHISGTRWNPEFKTTDSYLFSSIGHVWGWATWKRAWQRYDAEMHNWTDHSRKIGSALKKPVFIQFWKELFRDIYIAKHKHTWDYQWQYTLFKEGGLAIVPDVNLVSNIGLEGSHAHVETKAAAARTYVFNQPTDAWVFKKSPKETVQNDGYDIHHMKHHFLKFAKRRSLIRKYISYYLHA